MNGAAGSSAYAPLYGLTGLYCAGKNYIASQLSERGFAVLDVDLLGREVLNQNQALLKQRWGDDIVLSSGEVDRKALGARVFDKPAELAVLEAIVHPQVNNQITRWAAEQNGRPRCVNAALLHKTAVFSQLDGIFLVRSPLIIRFFRARKRDNLPFAQIISRFSSQKSFISQYLKKKSDVYIINNRGFGVFSRMFQNGLNKKLDALLQSLACAPTNNKAGNINPEGV